MVGTFICTLKKYLKKAGAKSFHRRKIRMMKPEHKEKRIRSAKLTLKQYVFVVNSNTIWGRLINFFAMVNKNGNLNTKIKAELKKVIAKVWREMNKDKAMCRNLNTSIPTRP